MSIIVLCPSVTDVLSISVHDRTSENNNNKLVHTSLQCVQYQMGEHSDTQGGYLSACSEPKSHSQLKTRVFCNSSYEWPKSRASETVQDVKSQELQHSSVKTKHSQKSYFIQGCHVETSNLKKKHIIGRYLPCFVSRKAQLSLEEQMLRYEDILLSAARDAGCLSLAGLLKLVIRRKCFPKCRSKNLELHQDDQQLIKNFNFWLNGWELNHKWNISPSSCTASLLHWRVLGVLLEMLLDVRIHSHGQGTTLLCGHDILYIHNSPITFPWTGNLNWLNPGSVCSLSWPQRTGLIYTLVICHWTIKIKWKR